MIVNLLICYLFFKSELIVEVWDSDPPEKDDIVDNFTLPISSPLNGFNHSSSHSVQGNHSLGKLTLNYGNLSIDTSLCISAINPSFTTTLYIPEGNI